MKEIQLSQRQVALIDDQDSHRVLGHRWSFYKNRESGNGYAVSSIEGKNVTMHRFILGVTDPTILVDHINGNGLDNRRCNLRIATRAQNNANSGKRKTNTSGFKGVHFTKRRAHLPKPWAAYLGTLKKTRFLGYFETAVDAAKAYDKAALTHHGEFARLNFG